MTSSVYSAHAHSLSAEFIILHKPSNLFICLFDHCKMFWNEVKMTGRPGGRFPGHLTRKPGVTCVCNSPKCFKNKANFLYFMGTYVSPLICMSVTHAHRVLLGAHVILQTSSCSGLSNAGTLFLASKVRIKSWWLNSLSTAVGIINFVHRFFKINSLILPIRPSPNNASPTRDVILVLTIYRLLKNPEK